MCPHKLTFGAFHFACSCFRGVLCNNMRVCDLVLFARCVGNVFPTCFLASPFLLGLCLVLISFLGLMPYSNVVYLGIRTLVLFERSLYTQLRGTATAVFLV